MRPIPCLRAIHQFSSSAISIPNTVISCIGYLSPGTAMPHGTGEGIQVATGGSRYSCSIESDDTVNHYGRILAACKTFLRTTHSSKGLILPRSGKFCVLLSKAHLRFKSNRMDLIYTMRRFKLLKFLYLHFKTCRVVSHSRAARSRV
jgi:hypothetical protein